jgi:dihydroneopterin aldolase
MTAIPSRQFQLRAIETQCSIGIHDFEREAPQRILVDIDVLLDPNQEPQADRIDEALNYDDIRVAVLTLATSRHFDLQETLARAIFNVVSDMKTVQAVRVKTSKPDVYQDVGSVSYQLSDFPQ